MSKINNFWWNVNGSFYNFLMNDVHNQLFKDVIAQIDECEGKLIDDLGCGTGELISLLPKNVKVRGIDNSFVALKKAKNLNPEAEFFQMNFYNSLPKGEKPDVVMACRSLYHPNLELSLSILANHVAPEGQVIIVHPSESFKVYVCPLRGKDRKLDLIQLIKSSGRLTSRIFGYDYSLFSAEEFKRMGRNYFEKVEVGYAGYETHLLVNLRNPLKPKSH